MIIDIANTPVPEKFSFTLECALTGGWDTFDGWMRGLEFKNGKHTLVVETPGDWFNLQRLALIVPELKITADEDISENSETVIRDPDETDKENTLDLESDKLAEMTVKELKALAKALDVDISGARLKADVIDLLLRSDD